MTTRNKRRRQSECFLPEEVELMILENMMIVEARKEPFGVNREMLSHIINNVNSFNHIADKRTRIIKKSAHLLMGMAYEQPFKQGNKEIGLTWTAILIERNGFQLPLGTINKMKDVYKLMENTGYKMEVDNTILSEVEEFLKSRIVSLD